MKKTFILISIMLMGVTSASMAVTLSEHSGHEAPTTLNASTTHFALSGTITSYQPLKSVIFIDGKEFILDGQGELTNDDLKAGTRIKFNVEKSTQEKVSHITKIWLNTENR